ncbi:MAG: hypothetical protein IPI46_10295 [Bacteroidetes bacterium]|nr:hypothetical protein [Bacteroidota bacterium]
MPAFISHFVHITQNAIWLNGKLCFSAQGKIDEFLKAAYLHLQINYPKFYKMDTMSKLGILASELLLQQTSQMHTSFKRGMLFQNASSSLASDKKYQTSIETLPSPALFVYTLPNIVMGEIAIRHQLKGENTFFITASFDAKSLANYVQIVFEKNILTQALIGYLEYNHDDMDVFLCLIENQGEITVDESNLNKLYNEVQLPKGQF